MALPFLCRTLRSPRFKFSCAEHPFESHVHASLYCTQLSRWEHSSAHFRFPLSLTWLGAPGAEETTRDQTKSNLSGGDTSNFSGPQFRTSFFTLRPPTSSHVSRYSCTDLTVNRVFNCLSVNPCDLQTPSALLALSELRKPSFLHYPASISAGGGSGGWGGHTSVSF